MTTRSIFRPTVDSGGRKPDRPQVGVHVVDQAEHRAPAPQRRQVGHPVADLDDQVGAPEVPQVGQGRAEELGVRAAVAHDPVRAFGHRPAAQQRDPVAAGEHAGRQPVDQDLRAAGLPVGQIPPRDEHDVAGGLGGAYRQAGPAARAERIRQPVDPGRPRRGRQAAGQGLQPAPEAPLPARRPGLSPQAERLDLQSCRGSRSLADGMDPWTSSQVVIPWVRIAALFGRY